MRRDFIGSSLDRTSGFTALRRCASPSESSDAREKKKYFESRGSFRAAGSFAELNSAGYPEFAPNFRARYEFS